MLTPFLVARAQLLSAIDLFFGDRDPVSVQALAGNARELLESLCRLNGIEPMTELLMRDNQKERKDIYAAMNLYRNCFKHLGKTKAERDDDQETLKQFDDTKNEYLLYICVEDYFRFRGKAPLAMQVFQLWFIALHQDLLENPPEFLPAIRNRFPRITEMPRADQKRVAIRAVKDFAADPVLYANPRTEPTILASE